jgi:hypothetical protein
LAIFMLACFLVDVCVFVSERVLLCSPGWSWTTDPSASAFQVWGHVSF